MSENRIRYTARTYEEYKDEFIKLTKKYYPHIQSSFGDAAIGQWFVELISSVSDELSYSIDRTYQETSLDSAQTRTALLNIARTNGVKVPGPKSAMVEVELKCVLPMVHNGNDALPDIEYAPTIKRGTLFSDGKNVFELMSDVNFKEQFDEFGISNRVFEPRMDSNENINGYYVKKLAIASAGQSKIYKKVIQNSDMVPFMTVTLNDSNILNVESIIVKDGDDLNSNPTIDEFYVDRENYRSKSKTNGVNDRITRYFEVDSLLDQFRFGYEDELVQNGYYNPIWYYEVAPIEYIDNKGNIVIKDETVEFAQHARGLWKRLKHKFITEFKENGDLDIIFGPGLENEYGRIEDIDDAKEFSKYLMSRMHANDYMGVLPQAGDTMFILYRVGGGAMSNISKYTLNNITYLNGYFPCNPDDGDQKKIQNKDAVRKSLTVTNPTQSYGGKDAPSNEELKYLIKYSTGAQNRCVTVKDYEARIMELPPMYGTPFRVGVTEENNKIVIYALGLDSQGKLSSGLSETVAENILTYLEKYRMVNDFVEIKSGKIINLQFDIDVFIDKVYNKSEVVKRIIDAVYDYMDIRRHTMGSDLFLGDLMKEISKIDGVINLIELRCYNQTASSGDSKYKDYSPDRIPQALVDNVSSCDGDFEEDSVFSVSNRIDLKASDMVLLSENNSMFEIKNKEEDIRVRVKER